MPLCTSQHNALKRRKLQQRISYYARTSLRFKRSCVETCTGSTHTTLRFKRLHTYTHHQHHSDTHNVTQRHTTALQRIMVTTAPLRTIATALHATARHRHHRATAHYRHFRATELLVQFLARLSAYTNRRNAAFLHIAVPSCH